MSGSSANLGVYGETTGTGVGVTGNGRSNGVGVLGWSGGNDGIQGTSASAAHAGVNGQNESNGAKGFLAGVDPLLGRPTGVSGSSVNLGVLGRPPAAALGSPATGVLAALEY